jgi:hypothetical protein
MPKEAGGLIVRDLLLTNKELMMKWMWMWHKSADVWWKEISGTKSPLWNLMNISKFCKSIKQLVPIFDCSTHFNGNKTLWIRNSTQVFTVSSAYNFLLARPLHNFEIRHI